MNYMTDFQKMKLELIRELSNVKSKINYLDNQLRLLYDETVLLQEKLIDLQEKNEGEKK